MKKEILTEDDDNYQLDIPVEDRNLNIRSYDYSVEFIVSLMNFKKIILEVPFQRKFIWKEERCSLLIESIIMNVPIPPLYFAEEQDGTLLVIDGLQRLYSILLFYQNEYSLKKLEIVKELEKKKYKDLPPKPKSLLDDGLLRVNVIKKDSHQDIKFDIFMRLNKGAVTLNYQELRNCLYRGKFNDTIKKLVNENKYFLKILKLKEPHDRFLDVEFIIRYFALTENLRYKDNEYCLENYKGRMVNYINEFMEQKKNISLEEAQKYAQKFNDTIEKVIKVFGEDKAFRDISIDSDKINKPLADIVLISFERIGLKDLEVKSNEIKKILTSLLNENDDFKKSISLRTSDKDVINKRINIWFNALKNASIL